MKFGKTVSTVVVASALLLALAACQKTEGPAERAGKEIDNTSEKVGQQFDAAGNKIERAAEKTGDALETAGGKVKDAVTPDK